MSGLSDLPLIVRSSFGNLDLFLSNLLCRFNSGPCGPVSLLSKPEGPNERQNANHSENTTDKSPVRHSGLGEKVKLRRAIAVSVLFALGYIGGFFGLRGETKGNLTVCLTGYAAFIIFMLCAFIIIMEPV